MLVVGLARTGVATALVLRGARRARDGHGYSRRKRNWRDVPAKLREAGVTLELGGHTEKTFLAQDLIVPSPGVPADARFCGGARERHHHLERNRTGLALPEGTLIGITGSNGKTTTTSLVDHILKTAGVQAILAGNIGTPLISCVDQTNDDTVTVVELSSFQLELIETFRPNIGVFLNLTPDHLDRHHTMEAYGRRQGAHV